VLAPFFEVWQCPHPLGLEKPCQLLSRLRTITDPIMRIRPTIVVVAAGSSRRFGAGLHKLDQGLGGSTVLGQTLRHAVQTQLPVVVVTTQARVPWVAGLLAQRDIWVLTEAQAALGMGQTIAAGVMERSGAPGWLVLPGDMPLVQPASLLAVASALELHPVAYAQYRGQRGHPVGFSAELYSELVGLQGDQGARRIVARFPAFGVEVEDAGVLVDIDTPSDLQAARALHAALPVLPERKAAA
jgi:molybdenum cofactor cytidylyltransferase